MRVLSGAEVASLVGVADLIAPIAAAMVEVSRGHVEMPLRSMVKLPGQNHMGIMAGHLGQPAGHGVKVLSLFPDNPNHGRSSHSGLFLLFDGTTGLPVLCMDAAVLTAIRTAAATAVASRVLARPGSAVLAILGLGEQAHSHIEAMRAVHPITRIIAWGRDRAKLAAFAEANATEVAARAADAVAQADIIVTATPARTPFLSAAMLRPGQHVNAVGASVAFMQELAADIVPATRFVTDYRPSLEPQAAEVIAARETGLIGPDHDIPEIGEIIAGTKPGRRGDDDITVYRSLGVAAQDLAAAHVILARAVARGVGTVVEMG
ncbi:MAG: ornithine cyclodeaminase family protein [Acetobacteraceae bacterium]|nr:ornithine cyclodeaminase family protein [Acetobacteraceae bacterium]